MMDIKARACFNCHEYMAINAGSTQSQAAMGKFDKDHSRHMVQTVAFGEIGHGYRSKTRQYLEAV
ncbi:MAG: hypothetical protein JW839_22245 [Candidatus Lokiarchaeota archaeon]|nr:hypothetical protein [Candidatus Lokiarchaeota archaeon]